jgi:RNA polymerase sigma-70 factor (ECF subfamily)
MSVSRRYGRAGGGLRVGRCGAAARRERVRKGMASLTAIQREAIMLAYFGGYSQSQVAQRLNLPLGTVKTRIHDGLIGLRAALSATSG